MATAVAFERLDFQAPVLQNTSRTTRHPSKIIDSITRFKGYSVVWNNRVGSNNCPESNFFQKLYTYRLKLPIINVQGISKIQILLHF